MVRDELREEELARKKVENKFEKSFSKRELPLKGTDKNHEFDLVSPDGLIVGEVKSSKSTKHGVSIVGRKMAEACLYLIGARGAAKRLLVLTDEDYYKSFKKSRHAGIAQAHGIEIMHVDTGRKPSVQEKKEDLPIDRDEQLEKTADKYLPSHWKNSPARKKQILGVIKKYLELPSPLGTMKRERKARRLVAEEEEVDPSTISDKYTRQIYRRDEENKTEKFRKALEEIEQELRSGYEGRDYTLRERVLQHDWPQSILKEGTNKFRNVYGVVKRMKNGMGYQEAVERRAEGARRENPDLGARYDATVRANCTKKDHGVAYGVDEFKKEVEKILRR